MGMRAPENDEDFPHAGAISAAEAMGAVHVAVDKPGNIACIDEENKVVSCVAYMYAGKPHEIYDSVGAMVDGMLSLLK
jgi:enhancing lycopene biosynthesis protein 2